MLHRILLHSAFGDPELSNTLHASRSRSYTSFGVLHLLAVRRFAEREAVMHVIFT